jgi:hypothetical protein
MIRNKEKRKNQAAKRRISQDRKGGIRRNTHRGVVLDLGLNFDQK